MKKLLTYTLLPLSLLTISCSKSDSNPNNIVEKCIEVSDFNAYVANGAIVFDAVVNNSCDYANNMTFHITDVRVFDENNNKVLSIPKSVSGVIKVKAKSTTPLTQEKFTDAIPTSAKHLLLSGYGYNANK